MARTANPHLECQFDAVRYTALHLGKHHLRDSCAGQALVMLLLAFQPADLFNPCSAGVSCVMAHRRPNRQLLFRAVPLTNRCGRSTRKSSMYRTAVPGMTAPHLEDIRERTIWSYWAQGSENMPDFFKLCVETWHRHNPLWDIRILERSTVHDYLTPEELPNLFMEMTSHQTVSDCVRLGLLSRYGGIWMDVSILLRCDLDSLCWSDIESGRKAAAVFYHPDFGTAAFQNKDFVESWFLATKPGNPFFLQWRDLLRELLHDRLNVQGLLSHPLYQDIDLSGIDRLNQIYGANFDFREYLAIHTMCHRLLETDRERFLQWQDSFLQIDAAATAFKLQLHLERAGESVSFAILGSFKPEPGFMDDVPLMKFTTPHSAVLQNVARDQIADDSKYSPLEMPTLIGRLLYDGPDYSRAMSLLQELHSVDVRPSRISYNAAIAACEKDGRWEGALSLLDEMRSVSLVPGAQSIYTAMAACRMAGQLQPAMSLLSELPRGSD